jgi:hypothetical protein
MPVKYQISEKSLEKREQILLLCKTSKSLNELSALTGDTVSSLRFNVKKLTESKHLKLKGTKLSDNKQSVHSNWLEVSAANRNSYPCNC